LASASYSGVEHGQRPTSPIDSKLLFVVVTLVMLGLIMVYAATYHRGFAFLKWQLVRAGVGLLALFLGTLLRYDILNRKVRWWLLVVSVVLLVVTLVFGMAAGAARRWFTFFIVSVQPAEIAKFVVLIWLAGYFTRLRESGKEWNFVNSVARPGAVVLVVTGLTLAQPAIGAGVIMAASCLALLFIVGVRLRYLVPVVAVAALAVVLTVNCVGYARDRWHKFASGDRYHQQQSLIAIGSGGPVGKGLGEGKQKFFFLPKMHNDFIFAEIGEEFGFLGSVAVFLLYGLLFLRGMRVGQEASGNFGQYLASGITIMVFMYALVHVAVTLGLVPTTGQPLPFVSFGGSALVTNLFAAGILLNVSRFRRNRTTVGARPTGWTASGRALAGRPASGVGR
jgi:cell division protein FtsW